MTAAQAPVRTPRKAPSEAKGERPKSQEQRSARSRVLLGAGVGAVVGTGLGLWQGLDVGLISGWGAGLLGWSALVWHRVWPMSGAQTREFAQVEDPTRQASAAFLVLAAILSLGLVGALVAGASKEPGLLIAILGTIVSSWACVHTVFMLRYAEAYYTVKPTKGAAKAIEFHDDEDPSFADFAYLSFTIGMTFQVSDTELNARAVRRLALRHSLVAYLFGTAIIATVVNVVGGLGK